MKMTTMSADMFRVAHKILDESYELSAFKFWDVDGNDAWDLFIGLKEPLQDQWCALKASFLL